VAVVYLTPQERVIFMGLSDHSSVSGDGDGDIIQKLSHLLQTSKEREDRYTDIDGND
jgi:hypothetical protein